MTVVQVGVLSPQKRSFQSTYSLTSPLPLDRCEEPTTPPKKRVRINEDANEAIGSVDADDFSKRWYSAEDLQSMYNETKATAGSTPNQHELAAAVRYLMQSYANCVDRVKLSEHVKVLLKDENTRGLERIVVASVGQTRKRAIRDVLKRQRELRQRRQDYAVFNLDIEREIIKVRSMAQTQSLRQLAFRLGQVDEYVAKQNHKEDGRK